MMISKIAVLTIFLSGFSPSLFAQGLGLEGGFNPESMLNVAGEFLIRYSFQVIGGIITLVAGLLLAGFLGNMVRRTMLGHKIDITVIKFTVGAVKLAVIAFAIIVALAKFGIEIAPLIAGISVVGFGTSFALQGPLSNLASGVALVFAKPFKIGDIIEVAGVTGEVTDIKLARTVIKTLDAVTIVIPNRHIIGEVIHNYTAHKLLEIKVGVSYGSDASKAIDIVKDVVKNHPNITGDRQVNTGISRFGNSGITLYSRAWCRQDVYWATSFEINKSILERFKENNITIPFPQLDLYVRDPEGKRPFKG